MSLDRTASGESIAARLDGAPTNLLHVLIAAICAAGLAFDIAEMAMGSALSAVFTAPPHAIGSQELGWLLAAPYFGAIFGAPALGRAADLWGRRRVLTWILLLQGFTSILAGFSSDVMILTVLRCACGVALGAYVPVVVSYLTDVLPPARRGFVLLIVAAVGLIGGPAAVFLVHGLTGAQLLGIEGFQWGFIVFGAASAAVGLLFPLLPESPRWLAETGRNEKAEAAIRRFERAQPLETRAILQPAETPSALDPDKHPWPVLGGIFFLSPWATVVFPILGGAVLLQKGFALSQALFLVGTAMIGPVIGTLASAFVFDRLTRRGALVLCAVGMLISSVLFALASGPVTLLISSMAFGVFAAVYVPGLNLFASELFTTRKRAGATSTLWAINRVGSAAGPLVLTPLFAEFGATPFFTGIALTLICIAGLFLFAPVGRARRAVD